MQLLVEEQKLTNKLLMEKVKYLESRLQEAEEITQHPKSQPNISEVIKNKNQNAKRGAIPKDKKLKDKESENEYDNKTAADTLRSKSFEPSKTNNAERLELQQHVMESVVDLEKDTGEKFQRVSYRKPRKHKKPNLGTAIPMQEIGGLEAIRPNNQGNKKLWLFLSRIKETVREEEVKKYVANKASITEDQFDAKTLKTKSTRSDYKCFMIGVPMDLIDQVYDSGFWPSGIAFSRFDFKRGHHFLESSPQMSLVNQD